MIIENVNLRLESFKKVSIFEQASNLNILKKNLKVEKHKTQEKTQPFGNFFVTKRMISRVRYNIFFIILKKYPKLENTPKIKKIILKNQAKQVKPGFTNYHPQN